MCFQSRVLAGKPGRTALATPACVSRGATLGGAMEARGAAWTRRPERMGAGSPLPCSEHRQLETQLKPTLSSDGP